MKLSVIIVNYNVKHFVEQCLHSVFAACKGLDAEIWVVDNNSVDGSVDSIRLKFPTVKLIENKKNVGFSAANNQAINRSTGEYILLLNPDTVVQEDTFSKIITFMDLHPDGGGLGVKMIDGSGNFLPESKRGLPTPAVAFMKMSGLSTLFPKSKFFNRYHLGYLDKNKNHEVEILSGAFMLLRRKALDKAGLLDETFFMYGEDIDLSYRIIKSGFKNYYFSETSIIHYKGESTKKSSVNYVFVFYEAMVIFAKKHFSQQNAKVFAFLIKIAIYLRAGAALFVRFLKRMFLPLVDIFGIYFNMYLIKIYWEKNIKYVSGGEYPAIYMQLVIPVYLFVWIGSLYLVGAYDKKSKPITLIKGIAIGSVIILVFYALLPESMRFSRAMILIGTASAMAITVLIRFLLHLTQMETYNLRSTINKRIVIVGESAEANRVTNLLSLTTFIPDFIGYVHTRENAINTDENYLGTIHQLKEIIAVHHIDEVIFCAGDIPSNEIITQMTYLVSERVEFKIAPPESMYIIGSSSVHSQGDLYTIDINSVGKSLNQRNKRLFDVLLSLFFLLFIPIHLLFVNEKRGFIKNCLAVLLGIKSWIGYSTQSSINTDALDYLPPLKPGVLNPTDIARKAPADFATIDKLNLLYAKDYSIFNDLNILTKGYKLLGRRLPNT